MPFWSGETLAAKLPTQIVGFDAGRIDCAAYTLSIGSEVYVSPSDIDPNHRTATSRTLAEGEAFVVPPGQFGLLLTEEEIHMPKGTIGFISIKSGLKLKGLVNVSGFHVDPNYTGRLIFSVFNAGPRPIHMRRGDPSFLIWFADLDKPDTSKIYSKPGHKNIGSQFLNGISGELMSLESLNSKITTIEKKQTRIDTTMKLLGGAILGIAIAAVAVPYVRDLIAETHPSEQERAVKPEPEQQAPTSRQTPSNEP